jgi:hypothetical protein
MGKAERTADRGGISLEAREILALLENERGQKKHVLNLLPPSFADAVNSRVELEVGSDDVFLRLQELLEAGVVAANSRAVLDACCAGDARTMALVMASMAPELQSYIAHRMVRKKRYVTPSKHTHTTEREREIERERERERRVLWSLLFLLRESHNTHH